MNLNVPVPILATLRKQDGVEENVSFRILRMCSSGEIPLVSCRTAEAHMKTVVLTYSRKRELFLPFLYFFLHYNRAKYLERVY